MLVISRRELERIVIDDEIEIVVLKVRGNRVLLGIEAPNHLAIHRKEVWVKQNDDEPRLAS